MDDDTITGRPPEEAVTEGPVSPTPPLTIEAHVGFKARLAADADGKIGEMMLSFAAAQPEEVREKLENDVDAFNAVWDKFANAFPPRPAPPPPQEPPPRELRVPAWKRAEIEREARQSRQVIGPWSVIGGGGVMPEPGTAARVEAKKFNREVNDMRQAIRENPANRDLEYRLAEKLFPNGLGKPSHGPDHY